MTQSSDELLSALLDGECTPAELDDLLRDCAASSALARRFERFCLVRDVLHGGVAQPDRGFCARVMAQVSAPAVRHIRLPWHRRRQVRPVVGLALAASLGALLTVAVVRIGAVPYTGHVPAQLAARHLPVVTAAASVPRLARATPVTAVRSGPAPASTAVTEVSWDQLQPEAARQLDDFLMEHASYRAGEGMGGALSYARVAAHQISYQSDGRSP